MLKWKRLPPAQLQYEAQWPTNCEEFSSELLEVKKEDYLWGEEGLVKKELSSTWFSLLEQRKPSSQHQVHVEFRYAALAFGPLAAKPISPSWRCLHRGDAHTHVCM